MAGDFVSNNARRGFLALLVAVFACALVTGCSGGSATKAEADSQQETAAAEQAPDENKDADGEGADAKKELTAADARQAALDSFIESYNSTASTPFVLNEYFDPKDKAGAHYRTEYRLPAWADGKGASGTIGEIGVDFVSYRDGVRMYANLKDVDMDGRAALLGDALGAYLVDHDSGATAAFVQEYKGGGNKELSSSDLRLFDKRLNGYIYSTEMMLEAK